MAWSLFVAVVVAVVALQQAMAHRELAPEAPMALPQALMSGQPLPYTSRTVPPPLHWTN